MKKWNPPECCFDFDWKMPEGNKVLLLRHIRFYFRVACFIYFSLLPEVDKAQCCVLAAIALYNAALELKFQ